MLVVVIDAEEEAVTVEDVRAEVRLIVELFADIAAAVVVNSAAPSSIKVMSSL